MTERQERYEYEGQPERIYMDDTADREVKAACCHGPENTCLVCPG